MLAPPEDDPVDISDSHYSDVDPITVDFLVEQVQHKLQSQEGEWNTLRTNVGILLAAAALVLPSVMELGTPAVARLPVIGLLWAVAFLALATSILYSLLCLLPRHLRNDPDAGDLVEDCWNRHHLEAKLQVLSNLTESYGHNSLILSRAFQGLKTASWLLIIAVVVFFVLVLLSWGINGK